MMIVLVHYCHVAVLSRNCKRLWKHSWLLSQTERCQPERNWLGDWLLSFNDTSAAIKKLCVNDTWNYHVNHMYRHMSSYFLAIIVCNFDHICKKTKMFFWGCKSLYKYVFMVTIVQEQEKWKVMILFITQACRLLTKSFRSPVLSISVKFDKKTVFELYRRQITSLTVVYSVVY